MATSSQDTDTSSTSPSKWPIRPYTSRHASWPYKPEDFIRSNESPDTQFYSTPRFVAHIDSRAIARLTDYYDSCLPKRGTILDFCSSWISHYPPSIKEAQERGDVRIIGAGLNAKELERNELLKDEKQRIVQDLNVEPDLKGAVRAAAGGAEDDTVEENDILDAATCVVSIDYLSKPLEVLKGVRECMKPDTTIHVAISNRAFWDKVIRRWLEYDEEERLLMVADYLHFAGFEQIEIVDVGGQEDGEHALELMAFFGSMGSDPLWVIRGRNPNMRKVEA